MTRRNSTPVKRDEVQILKEVIEKTSFHTGTTLTLALSYGSREELKTAVKTLCSKVKNNLISPDHIDETIINNPNV